MHNQKIYLVENNKQDLIKKLSKQPLQPHKFYTLKEFKKELFYDYDIQTLLYLMNKYHLNYQVAKIYLANLYYIEDKTYQSSKLNFLVKIKQDLLNHNLLIINPLFPDFLKNNTVIFYGDFTSQDKSKLLTYLKSITDVEEEKTVSQNQFIHNIYSLPTIEEEVTFVANKIIELIKSGIAINKIYLTNLTEDYYPIIKRLFTIFKIPYNLLEKNSLFGTVPAQKFLENLADPTSVFQEANPLNEELINLYNQYISIPNLEEIKPLIISDLKNTYLKNKPLKNAVTECNFNSLNIQDDEYVFLLNFNQGSIPRIHKDEEFLNNSELTELGLLDCHELNKIERINAYQKIISTQNVFITTKETYEGNPCYLSSLNEELNYPLTKVINDNFTNSHLYNELYLAKSYDNFHKYGITNPYQDLLSSNYPDLPYNTYDNSYKQILASDLASYLQDGLTLSYSSMDTYYRCSFRYYLNNILKLNIYEDTFMQTIGIIFHEVLEKSFIAETPFDTLWDDALRHAKDTYSKKEEFFLKKLKEELRFIIATINDQNMYSELDSELHEEKIVINYAGNIKITFKGFIDKVKYHEYDDATVIAIIDYKTGNPELNLNHSYYGIEMQLPVYLFLAKHSNKLKNVKVAGFYLQKILNNEILNDHNHTYEELKTKNLLLQGYSNADTSILQRFDNNYQDSQIIRGLKTSATGFYKYSKVLDSKTMDRLIDLVSQKIDNAIANITNADFAINPKQIGKINHGCAFCEFKDICFRKEENILKLQEYKNLEFLKEGEKNAKMD